LVKTNITAIHKKIIEAIITPGDIRKITFSVKINGSVILFHQDNNPRNLKGKQIMSIA
jgi:hypothetical protein